MNNSKFVFGGHEINSVNILRLLSELEGSYQMLKYLGFEEDMNTLNDLKSKYYKMYFKLNKEEKS